MSILHVKRRLTIIDIPLYIIKILNFRLQAPQTGVATQFSSYKKIFLL